MNVNNMTIGNSYSFATRSPTFLNARVTNARLIAMGDIDFARTVTPIDQLIAKVVPSLPAGPNYNPATEIYLVFTEENGNKKVLGARWIEPASIQEVTLTSYTIRCHTTDTHFQEQINAMMLAAGITNFSVTKDYT